MKRGTAGFTLIELLIALALGALVSLILLEGIRLAVSGLDRHSRAVERLDGRQSLDDLLRRTLAAAAAIPRAAGGTFIGRPDAVELLAVVEDSGPGLYRIDLGFDRPRQALILRRKLAAPQGDPRAAAGILYSGVRAFHLAYFGADALDATPAWRENWQQPEPLPLLVRVMLDSDDDLSRPPLIIKLWNAR